MNISMNIIIHLSNTVGINDRHPRNLFLKSFPIRLWYMTNSAEHNTVTPDPAIKIYKWEGML